ncbi:unnamed protein product [Rhizoctonia solani]|uniref:Xylanolytic transcriptional activator regulatory domain-containing protein n=1 Tax=Rhizoctonia solani TaxID=456999 RepID=A0A8H3BT26_9AGAM|nr:unnamed protein product [Rhizoctonia solani]
MRIRELESEIAQLSARPISEIREQNNPANRAMSPTDPVPITEETMEEYPRRSHLTMQDGNISASGPTSMWSTFPDESVPLRESKGPHSGLIYRYTFERSPSIPLHIQSQDIQMSERCEWDRYLPKFNSGVGFTRFEHDTLLYRCFNYHTLWLRTLQPDLFLRDMLLELTAHPDSADATKSGRGLSYYSPFLHCALMAFATTFSTDPGIRSKHIRETFARYAKQLLEDACACPTLTAIHGLVFLSEYHGSLGERGLAYLYFGMGCRIVRALGLCINGRKMVESEMITEQELTSRVHLFWALFSQDKLMSLEYGREYDVPLPHLDVGLPFVDPIRDQLPWEEIQSTGNRGRSRPNQATLVFFQGCRLMLIAIRIMDTVYLQGRQQVGAAENNSISDIHKLLENWHKHLPAQIRVPPQYESPPLPHVIVLHITYWWLLMLLHRPFSFRVQPFTPDQPTPTAIADLSADICERAAKNVVQLVAIFDQAYGCRLFPLNMLQAIFMAGAILLGRHVVSPGSAGKQHTDAHSMAQECIRALRTAAQTWDVARLYASQLEALLSEQFPQPFFDSYNPGGGVYEPSVPEHDDTLSQMFRDFIDHHDQDVDELGIPLVTMQFQYPLSQQLNQQPQLGRPSGPEFIMGPDASSLQFGPYTNEGELVGTGERFPSHSGA